MIKAIIFDCGNVICHVNTGFLKQKINQLSGKTSEEIDKLVYLESGITKIFETGKMTSEGFYKELLKVLEVNIPYQELRTLYSKDKLTRVSGIKELIEKLKKNYKVGLLSNTSSWDWEYIVQVTPEVLTFDSITKSYEVGVMKPDEAIYKDALKKLNLKPEECVYTDDVLEYVEAAKSLGFEAFQFTTAKKFEEDLKSIGVKI